MTEIELNKKIGELHANKNSVIKKDLITFYWTRKNPNLILNILDAFLDNGDVIYDPFMGSAPILYSMDKCGKNLSFVGSEINEMPISFTKFNLSDLSEDRLNEARKKYQTFFEKYKDLYEYKSPQYREQITLSKLVFDVQDGENKVKTFYFSNQEKITINEGNEGFESCLKDYIERCNELAMKAKDYDVELIANSRIAVKEGMLLSQLFNPINFFVLTQFSKEFQNDSIMLTVLSSVLHLCRLTDLKSQSQFPYWVPKKDVVERNILLLIMKKINEIVKGKKSNTLNLTLVDTFNELQSQNKGVLIINKPSQLITTEDIPNNSIDYVITDPPYFDQVAYSEYLKIWEHICHLKSNLNDEIIFSNRKVASSNEQQYLDNLTKCFSVVAKKLKEDGIAIIFFKDSKPKNIHLFLKAMENSGLAFIRALHVGNKKYTYKQNTTQDTTVDGECLFFFDKGFNRKIFAYKEEDVETKNLKGRTEEVVKKFALGYLQKNKEASLGELYDNGLLYALYVNDILRKISSSKIIVEILNENFILQGNRRYLIDQAKI
ncbi:site-specific DNA-methyltransferase [Polynucleobacter paneuropaeus]|nr:site-specific DNA-methyltransferase [Polynucleobacter paneuropaeus]